MASNSNRKARLEVVDLAKALTIFMVVWGHTATNDVLFGGSAPMLYRVLYSIHMPLFFFLSGMSISTTPLKTKKEWGYFIKKLILTIAFPYFVWALIYSTFTYSNVAWIFYGSWQALTKVATLTSLWYLSCLFVARIMVECIINFIANKTKWKLELAALIIGVVFLIIGLILPYIEIGYPWCFDVAFVASACILFGIALKKPLFALSVQKTWVLIAALLGSIAVYAVTAILRGDNFEIMQMCKNIYGEGIGVLICAVFGGLAIMLISMLLMRFAEVNFKKSDFRPIMYIGQYTMGVFLLHKPMLQQVILPFFDKLFGNGLSSGFICFISALAALIVSLALCNVIQYYVPELIGIFSKDKIAKRDKEAG